MSEVLLLKLSYFLYKLRISDVLRETVSGATWMQRSCYRSVQLHLLILQPSYLRMRYTGCFW